MKIRKFNEDVNPNIDVTQGEVNIEKAMENRKISDLTVKELKEIIRLIVSSELSKRGN